MKSNQKFSLRLFCSVLVLMCSGAIALAQSANADEYPKVEIFAGYSALGEAGSRGISFGPTDKSAEIIPPSRDLRLR